MINSIKIEGKVDGKTFPEALQNSLDNMKEQGYYCVNDFRINGYQYVYNGDGKRIYLNWKYEAEVNKI